MKPLLIKDWLDLISKDTVIFHLLPFPKTLKGWLFKNEKGYLLIKLSISVNDIIACIFYRNI